MRLFDWLFAPKPYGCGFCGKRYRTDVEQGKCVWAHALDPRLN